MKGTEAWLFGFFGLAAIALGIVSYVRWRTIIREGVTIE